MPFRAELLKRAAARKARIVLAEGEDPRVQAAAERLARDGIAVPVVLGGKGLSVGRDPRLPRVAQLLRERRPEQVRDGVDALDQAADPLRFAAGLVALGEADGVVGGAAHANVDVLKAALWAFGAAEGIERASSAFYAPLPDGRVLTFTDCAVVPEPTPAQLAGIALAAARDRVRIVGDEPRVAFLSYATLDSARGPAVTRVREALARFRELAPGVAADGPLQGDAALDAAAAGTKAPGSAVAGRANVLVFPGLDAGNIAFRLLRILGGLPFLGPLHQGLARPMTGLSRAAGPDDIVEMAALVALQGGPSTF
jgi:phosphate acetyltransferase